MRVTRIIIERREYSLPAEYEVGAIMARITEQVRAGGGFVELVRTPQRTVNVLVSPGTSVSIEVLQIEDDTGRGSVESEQWERSWLDPFELV